MKEWVSYVHFLRHTGLIPSPKKGVQDHSWVKPFCQPIVVSLESLGLLMMDEGENGIGRGTVLELGDKWMGKGIVLGTFLVGSQGIVED